ncbi:MAG: NAD-dependent epimerase/dehydratase family protein [Nitrospinota bacterium]
MKLLITGASSTLGKNLASELLKTGGFSLRLLEHHSPVKIEGCETVKGNIQDSESLERACSGMDGVIHMAALTHSNSPKAYFEVNETGTENLVRACLSNNVKRFIFISSSAASESGGGYGLSKLRAEEKVRNAMQDWVILRPSEVYGPKMDEGIGKLMEWVRRFPVIPVIGDGSYLMSPVYVDDVIQAIVEVLKNNSLTEKSLNLCGPEVMTMNEVIDRLSLNQNVRRRKVHLPIWFVKGVIAFLSVFQSKLAFSDQVPRLLCDKDRSLDATKAVIAFNPRKIEEGLLSYRIKAS